MTRAAALLAWLTLGWWELRTGDLIGIALPSRSLPVPVLFWSGWLLYVWAAARAPRAPLRAVMARELWPGLIAHGLLLIADLQRVMRAQGALLLEGGYLAYCAAAFALVLVLAGVWLGRWSRRDGRTPPSPWSSAPVALAAAWLCATLAIDRQWWALGAAACGWLLGWTWTRWAGARSAVSRVWAWAATPQGMAVMLWMAAWLVRWVYGLRLLSATGADFVRAGDDSDTNDAFAWRFAQDPAAIMEIDRESVYPPGYWMVLGVIYRAVGHRFDAVVLVQTLLSALVPVCVYWLTRRLIPGRSGELAARVAGLLAVLNTGLIHCSVVLDQEAIYLPFLFLGLCALLRAVGPQAETLSRRWLCAAGVLFGLANLMRPITLFIPAVIFAWLLCARRRIGSALRDTAWCAVPMLLVLMPLVIRNAVMSGGEVLSVTSEAAGHYRALGNEPFLALGINPFGDPLGTLAAIARQPAASAQAFWTVVPPRVVRFFFVPFFGNFDPVLILNANVLATAYALTLEFYAYAAMAVGCWWLLRAESSRVGTQLFLWMTAYFALTPVFWFIRNATYRVPLHPIFLIWLAAGVLCLWPKGRSHDVSV